MKTKFRSKITGYVAACILPLLSCSALASSCEGDIPADKMSRESAEIKIEGMFDFKAGGRSQKNLEENEESVSNDKKGFAFNSSAAIFVSAQDKTDSGMTYGARITLVSNTKASGSNGYQGTHAFLKHNDYGKFELGSATDAASAMAIFGDESAAVGGGWTPFAVLNPKFMQYGPVGAKQLPSDFAADYDFFLDDMDVDTTKGAAGKVERARKISYYTPKFKDMLQFGISYIPDSKNAGTGGTVTAVEPKLVEITDNLGYEIPKSVVNAIAAGVTFEKDLAEDTKIKLALTGEHGKPSSKMKSIDPSLEEDDPNRTLAEYALSNLNTYNIGAELVHGNLSCSASYSDLGKSLTNSEYHKAGRKTKYYGGTVAYDYGPIKTSLSYNHFDKFNNKMDVFSLEGKVKLAPGLSSYAGVYRFSGKGRPVYYPDREQKKLKGTAALIGAKIKF